MPAAVLVLVRGRTAQSAMEPGFTGMRVSRPGCPGGERASGAVASMNAALSDAPVAEASRTTKRVTMRKKSVKTKTMEAQHTCRRRHAASLIFGYGFAVRLWPMSTRPPGLHQPKIAPSLAQ